MGSPYRGNTGELPIEGPARADETLVRYDVTAERGVDGPTGSQGAQAGGWAGDGRAGGNAGVATVGEDAGALNITLSESDIKNVARLSGTEVRPSGETSEIERTQTVGGDGFIDLVAIGGDGGNGGVGGDGGRGSTGLSGADATQFSSGDDGGQGGRGGDGGNGTDGARGGVGGDIVVNVDEASTHLLMLVRHNVSGGRGGKKGINGRGGAGGAGGSGGNSFSWTESSSSTDSDGNTYTTVTHHYNPGGSQGPSGARGRVGGASISAGEPGVDGRLSFAVHGPAGRADYPSRYHLRLVSLEHRTLNGDFVYEPRETIIASQITLENVGSMPTPTGSDVHISIEQQGWIDADEHQHLVVPRGLGPGQKVTLDGDLRFRLSEYKPRHAAAPLEVEEALTTRARVEAVRRSFDGFVGDEVRDQCLFVIRFPLACSPVSSMPSLAPGQVTRVRWTLRNQSGLAMGAASKSRRRIRVHLYAIESELGDAEFTLFDETGKAHAPSSGYSKDIELLEAGETFSFDICLGAQASAPPHRAMTMRLAVQLGDPSEPDFLRTIQFRDVTTRVAPRYRPDAEANMLLVTNHKTSAQAISAWKRAGMLIGARLNWWDLTLEGHLDLDRRLDDGRSLLDHFFGKTIVVLNNTIDATGGQAIDQPEYWRHPHELLSKADVHAANRDRIDIAFIGADPDMGRLLMPLATVEAGADASAGSTIKAESGDDLVTALATVPGETETALVQLTHTIDYTDRQWWGGLPDVRSVGESAEELQRELIAEYPDRRYLVVYDFNPVVESKFLWIKKWKIGEVQVQSCLDPVAGSVAHATVAEIDVDSPIQILSDGTLSTLFWLETLPRTSRDSMPLSEPWPHPGSAVTTPRTRRVIDLDHQRENCSNS